MPNIEVYCTVNNCHYWDEGNLCGADKILITLDKISREYSNEVDVNRLAMLVDEVGTTPAESGAETCCKTFRHRT